MRTHKAEVVVTNASTGLEPRFLLRRHIRHPTVMTLLAPFGKKLCDDDCKNADDRCKQYVNNSN